MKSHRSIINIAVAVAFAALPATAGANSLLSGYGGPGQGSQVILGSTLLGGSAGGAGGGGGGSSAAASSGSATGGVGSVTGVGSGSGRSSTGARAGSHAAGRTGTAASVGAGSVSKGAGSASQPVAPSTLLASRAVGTQTLGLSSEDVVYMLLVLGALVLTAVFTRRLARSPG